MTPRFKNYALWTVQVLLALLFLFTGGTKLVMPIEVLTKQMPLPGLFVRFLGVAEVLGAIGLILPWLLRIKPGLTPLAAAGLVIIMIGATALTVAHLGVAPALLPFVTGILAAFVAYGPLAVSAGDPAGQLSHAKRFLKVAGDGGERDSPVARNAGIRPRAVVAASLGLRRLIEDGVIGSRDGYRHSSHDRRGLED